MQYIDKENRDGELQMQSEHDFPFRANVHVSENRRENDHPVAIIVISIISCLIMLFVSDLIAGAISQPFAMTGTGVSENMSEYAVEAQWDSEADECK